MEENDLVVANNDVPETSENNEENLEVSVNASQDEINQDDGLEVKKDDDDIEKRIEEEVNKRVEEKIESRLIRDRNSRERKQAQEMAGYKQLANVIQAGLGVDNLDEAIKKTSDYYKEQGINIPEFKDSFSDKKQERYGKVDAQDIIELGVKEMEEEANRLANIPIEKRTPYESGMFNELCSKLSNLKDVDELKAKGYNADILQTKEFSEFRNQFNFKTPISTIYEMYSKINGQKVEQPASPGSAKTSTTNNEIKDYYSSEDFDKLTKEDLDNPKVMEIVNRSRLQWYKES